MKQFTDGTLLFGAPDLAMGAVDVRDVADAHLRAGFTPEAHGRYIVNAQSLTLLEIGKILRHRFGKFYPFPRTTAPKAIVKVAAPLAGLTRQYVDRNVGYPLKFDNSRSRTELGVTYHPVEQTVTEHFQQMLDDGVVRRMPW